MFVLRRVMFVLRSPAEDRHNDARFNHVIVFRKSGVCIRLSHTIQYKTMGYSSDFGVLCNTPSYQNPIQLGAVFSPKVGDYGPPFCSVLGGNTACSHTSSCPPLYVVTPDTALTSSASSSFCNPFQNTF